MAVTVETRTVFAGTWPARQPRRAEVRYENFIGGEWVRRAAASTASTSPLSTAAAVREVAHSTPADVELALDAAHAAKHDWGRTRRQRRRGAGRDRRRDAGAPADAGGQIGPQVSQAQLEKIESYVQIGLDEGAERRSVATPRDGGRLGGRLLLRATVLKGENSMRVFQEEIFGPVLAVTTFRDEQEALEIANDTMYGLGAGVRTRDGSRAFAWGAASKRDACGPTATTSTRPAQRSAATSPQASGARTTA